MAETSNAILFDMDGTLVQTREASWKLFEETNRKFGLGVDDRAAYFRLFEDNFFRSLGQLSADAAKLAAAKEHFLNLLRTRYSPELIPGMADVVRSLAPHFTLAILSTNTMVTIRKLLSEAGIATCFAHVFSGDVEPDKSVAIRRFLSDRGYGYGRSCSPAYREEQAAVQPTADSVILVTDTIGDVREAMSCGIRAIGVAWGMHGEKQLLAAGAEMVALWPQELASCLLARCDTTRSQAQACACDLPPADGTLVAAAAEARRGRMLAARNAPPASAPVEVAPPRIDPALLDAVRRIV